MSDATHDTTVDPSLLASSDAVLDAAADLYLNAVDDRPRWSIMDPLSFAIRAEQALGRAIARRGGS